MAEEKKIWVMAEGVTKQTLICTLCGDEVPEGKKAIFGIERDGKMYFGWTCCHHPVGDVAVVLASHACMVRWIETHPEHAARLAVAYQKHEGAARTRAVARGAEGLVS